MFPTARGFLLVAPLAFLSALVVFLLTHPAAAQSFTPYPFLVEALGPSLVRRPVSRFAVTATVFFLLPYLVTALLLALSDLGSAAAARLWRGRPAPRPRAAGAPPESRAVFFGGTVLLAALAGGLLHRVAHGGALPGGVNVAPLFVAAAPFVSIGIALALSAAAALPRTLARALLGPPGTPRPGAPAPRRQGAS